MGCPNNACHTVLDLGLSLESNPQNSTSIFVPNKPKQASCLNFEPSLSLGLCGGSSSGIKRLDVKKVSEEYSELSGVSSFSVKRERDVISDEDDRVSSRVISDEDDLFDANSNATRKKLRLTKEQSALLEDSFKQHSTLNPKQKQALVRQLNLRPRQVEVWFQNRRARTKLKQTEVDCEFLKKCCETLTDENRRLQKEVDELKALKMAQPFYMQMPAATLTMCPSCERINGININDSANSKNLNINNPFSMAPKPFYNPFTNPSAAC